MYGMDGIPISKNNIKKLDTIQGKQAVGLSKLLTPLNYCYL